jgi:hypothetical protein
LKVSSLETPEIQCGTPSHAVRPGVDPAIVSWETLWVDQRLHMVGAWRQLDVSVLGVWFIVELPRGV